MRISVLLLACLGIFSGCASEEEGGAPPQANEATPSVTASPSSDLVAPDQGDGSESLRQEGEEGPSASLRVVFMGTSLTEGLGLSRPEIEAWPAQVEAIADSAGFDLLVINAGLSGETSAGALRRVEWILRQTPDILILETGANDGLRGLPIEELESNLRGILDQIRVNAPGAEIVLVAMEAPPNLGTDYTVRFRSTFQEIASSYGVALTPFLLEGVAGIPELNQADGVHPTAEGHRLMARNAWPVLDSLFHVSRED